MLGSLDQLVHKDIDKGLLEAGAYIRLVLLHEFRILGHLITYKIQKRGLDSAEAIVETWDMRLGEFVFQRIAFLGKSVHDRSSRVSQAHHLGTFVKGFTHSVIDSLSKDFVFQRAVDTDDLGVAA